MKTAKMTEEEDQSQMVQLGKSGRSLGASDVRKESGLMNRLHKSISGSVSLDDELLPIAKSISNHAEDERRLHRSTNLTLLKDQSTSRGPSGKKSASSRKTTNHVRFQRRNSFTIGELVVAPPPDKKEEEDPLSAYTKEARREGFDSMVAGVIVGNHNYRSSSNESSMESLGFSSSEVNTSFTDSKRSCSSRPQQSTGRNGGRRSKALRGYLRTFIDKQVGGKDDAIMNATVKHWRSESQLNVNGTISTPPAFLFSSKPHYKKVPSVANTTLGRQQQASTKISHPVREQDKIKHLSELGRAGRFSFFASQQERAINSV
jgi:hypothetical protein